MQRLSHLEIGLFPYLYGSQNFTFQKLGGLTIMSTTDTRLPLSDVTGPVNDLLTKLAGDDGADWLKGLKKFLRKENPWKPLKAIKSKLLELVSDTEITGLDVFHAVGCFTKNNMDGVKFWYFGDNFQEHFLKKVEEGVEPATIKIYRLKEDSLDLPIIAALGDNHETKLLHLWELLKKQPKGEDGVLLTNGYANIFYIRAINGTLWAVHAYWGGGGWSVYAHSVGDPDGWSAARCLVADSLTLNL